jgi:hypothetical protein
MAAEAHAGVEQEMRKRWAIIALIAIPAGLSLFVWAYLPRDSYPGKVYESADLTTPGGQLRVVAAYEKSYLPNFVPGAYFTFYSRSSGASWREIMRFRGDDPIAIPKNSLQYAGDRVQYVFIGWRAAVSDDAGATWRIWDGSRDTRTRNCLNYQLIRDLHVAPDGRGEIQIDSHGKSCGAAHLRTSDFGHTWN